MERKRNPGLGPRPRLSRISLTLHPGYGASPNVISGTPFVMKSCQKSTGIAVNRTRPSWGST